MTFAMKIAIQLLLLAVFASSLAGEEPQTKEDRLAELHGQVDLLMKQRKAEEAAPLLETALELDPNDTKALGRLGMIYTLMLGQPEKAKPLLEKGSEMDDIKCLQALAIAYIATNDHEGITKFQKKFLSNFDDLSGSKLICFFIAGLNRDKDLFDKLLKRVTEEEISKDASLARVIATTAKKLAEIDN